MKIQEILTEAHHSILVTMPIGPWKVQIDTHAYATLPARDIPLENFTNMISYMCYLPDVLPTIPVGRGAYFQDTNTAISIYVTRVANNVIRVETVLDRTMKPKQPLFRRSVPAPDMKNIKPVDYGSIRDAVKTQGRDAVSQDMEKNLQPLMPVNRAERRKFSKVMRRLK
jgi:hypothetical protein